MKHDPYYQETVINRLPAVRDYNLLMAAVTDYYLKFYDAMAAIIFEYGRHKFFDDLSRLFDSYDWNRRKNKYMVFVGMTIKFMEYFEADIKN